MSLCYSILTCKEGHSGPTYESMQAVFDLQPFRPAENLSNPTITNISFTLYAVLGVVSVTFFKSILEKFSVKSSCQQMFDAQELSIAAVVIEYYIS